MGRVRLGRAAHLGDMARISAYGLSDEDYEAMLEAQDYRCAICLEPEQNGNRLSVDHDHSHKHAVRGLLCSKCNSAIGLLRDDADVVQRAAEYLRLHKHQRRPT
jgi:hypothetical protein